MKPTIIIQPDKHALATYMAQTFIENAAAAIEARGTFSVVLSGGGTPTPLYKLLATPDYAKRVEWRRVHFFWGDERMVPPTDDESNYRQAREALLEPVGVPERNIWRVPTEGDPETAAHEYQRQLEEFMMAYQSADFQYPIFDFVLLGMGSDGHTASLFPYSPLCVGKPTRAVSADYDGRPANRVTLTETIFNNARHVYVLVTGKKKAEMVALAVGAERDHEAYPIQRIEPKSGHLTFVLDAAAASKLPRS